MTEMLDRRHFERFLPLSFPVEVSGFDWKAGGEGMGSFRHFWLFSHPSPEASSGVRWHSPRSVDFNLHVLKSFQDAMALPQSSSQTVCRYDCRLIVIP